MAERKQDKRLQEMRDKGVKIYSISKLNTIDQCKHQAYLSYIKKIPREKRNKGIYGIMGSEVHDAIEAFCHNEVDLKHIEESIKKEMDMMDLLGISFPKDRNGNYSIRDNWLSNMFRFSKEFKLPTEYPEQELTIATEKLLLYKIDDDHCMMGYADAIRKNDDGTVTLIDWKTSANFTKKKLIEAGRQLVLYKLALEDMGYKVRECQWCMLKYCETSWKLKNGKTKTKVSEWRNLIKDLSKQIEKSLYDLGYSETDVESFMLDGLEKNSWDSFPEEIRNKYNTHVYYRTYEITDDIVNETLEYLNSRINDFETCEEWTPCDIDKNSFFCCNLCDFGGQTGLCKHYVDYLNSFQKEESDEIADLF